MTCANRTLVEFLVTLNAGVAETELRQALDVFGCASIEIKEQRKRSLGGTPTSRILQCSPSIFEKLFNVKLTFEEKEVEGSSGYITMGAWTSDRTPQIPKKLEKVIKRAWLPQPPWSGKCILF